MKKFSIISISMLLMIIMMCGCSGTTGSNVQTRDDLTREHFQGLAGGMLRKDVVDLVGEHDTSLAGKESVEVYSLADGSTAILRYSDDKLISAAIRSNNNTERTIFNAYEPVSDQQNAAPVEGESGLLDSTGTSGQAESGAHLESDSQMPGDYNTNDGSVTTGNESNATDSSESAGTKESSR